MPKGDFLGDFEQLVMLAVLRLGSSAYAVTIHQEIEERTGRSISVGAVYATLDRLEQKGLVSSYLGEATAQRGGRAKRFIELTKQGGVALRTSQKALRSMLAGMPNQWQIT